MRLEIIADSLQFARRSMNTRIMEGFKNTSIFLYNAKIIVEDEFSPSVLTARPDSETVERPERAIMSITDPVPAPTTPTGRRESESGTSNKRTDEWVTALNHRN